MKIGKGVAKTGVGLGCNLAWPKAIMCFAAGIRQQHHKTPIPCPSQKFFHRSLEHDVMFLRFTTGAQDHGGLRGVVNMLWML